MRLFKISLIIIVSIAIIGTASFLFWYNWNNSDDETEKPYTAEELLEKTLLTETITTNLMDAGLIKAEFAIETDSEETKQLLEKTMFQVDSTIIKILTQMTSEKISGPDGLELVESTIKNELNHLLEGEKVIKVYTTDRVIQ